MIACEQAIRYRVTDPTKTGPGVNLHPGFQDWSSGYRMNHPKSIKFLGGSSFDPHAFLHGSRWLSSPIHGHLPSQRLVGSHFLLHLFQSGPRFINLPRRGIGIHQGGEGEGLDVRGWGVQAVGE